jgi:predicted phosphodiesterase
MTKRFLLMLVIVFGTVHLLRAAQSSSFLLEPYLQNSTQGQVSILWQTTTPAYGWVEYGKTDTLGMKADMVIDGMRNANTTLHKVRLTDLEHGATYYYRSCFKPIVKYDPYHVDFGDVVYSEIHTFKGASSEPNQMSCVIFNDLHSNHSLFNSLCNALGETDYQFSIFNGDCIQDPKSLSTVNKSLKAYNKGVFAHSRPALYIRGNHEIRGAFARNMKGLFDFPDDEYFFAMTAGPVRLIFLDCGEDKSDDHKEYSGLNDFSGYRKRQKEWLKTEVKSDAFKQAKHRILIHHIPLYNHNDRATSILSRTLWAPILDSVPIDVAISGHTHQHDFIPTKAARNNYPVLIGGGKTLEDGTVIVLSATNDQLSIKMLNASGEIISNYKKLADQELKATD